MTLRRLLQIPHLETFLKCGTTESNNTPHMPQTGTGSVSPLACKPDIGYAVQYSTVQDSQPQPQAAWLWLWLSLRLWQVGDIAP